MFVLKMDLKRYVSLMSVNEDQVKKHCKSKIKRNITESINHIIEYYMWLMVKQIL